MLLTEDNASTNECRTPNGLASIWLLSCQFIISAHRLVGLFYVFLLPPHTSEKRLTERPAIPVGGGHV